MIKVITYGTFDLFHFGHLELFRRAKELGDYLIVAVSTDEFNAREKNKVSTVPFMERAAIVNSIKYVDLVIPENSWEQKMTDIKKYGVDIFVMGDDWLSKFDFLQDQGCKVIYLPRTPHISTTNIKNNIQK